MVLPWPREQLDRLPWRQRCIVLLVKHDHMTISRVAWLLNIAPASVEHDLGKAMLALGEEG